MNLKTNGHNAQGGALPKNSQSLSEAIEQVALAYWRWRGDQFRHLEVVLLLSTEVLSLAISNNVVGAFLQEYGREQGENNALLMLNQMLDGEGQHLSILGCEVMDEMCHCFCADVRAMLDEGKDPMAELASESQRRAMQ